MRLLTWCVALSLAVGVACRSDTTGPQLPPIEGLYELERIGERPVPMLLFQTTAQRYYVWYYSLALNNGIAVETWWYRDSIGPTTYTDNGGTRSGNYRASRDTVFFSRNGGPEDTAFVTSAGLTRPATDASRQFCPTGKCDYFFRRAP